MAKSKKLTAQGRRQLPASDFALPGKGKVKGSKGDYPIDTPGRAQNALGKAKVNATPADQAKVKKAVAKKYPGMKVSGTKNAKKK